MTIVYIILTILSVFLYLKKKYLPFILCYTALMTELFLLDTIGSSIRGSDLCFFMNFILFPVAISRRRKENIDDKKINKVIKLFIGFILFEFALTCFTGADSVSYALKVIRVPLMFFAYYPFSTIPLDTYKRFIKIMLWGTIIQGILFLLQFVGINLLAGRFDSEAFAFAFALNIPTFTYFFIFFSLDTHYIKKYKYPLLAFLFVILLFTYVRSVIISLIVCIIIYVVTIRGLKRSMPIIMALVIIAPIAMGVLEKKSAVSGSSMSTGEEIQLLFTGVDNLRQVGNEGGSSIFRFAMLIERFDYLIQNPEYLMFGVGAIHEDSPNCYNRFDFALGTRNEGRMFGKCMIESGDITWVPVTLRYGLVGIAMHLFIIITIAKLARKRNDVLKILFPLIIFFFMKSFNGALFEKPWGCIELVLYLSLLTRCNAEKKELII